MCLCTKQICPIKARKDIVCYKAFRLDGRVLVTPYQNVLAWLGSTMTARPINENFGDACVFALDPNNPPYRQRIYGGFIHAYINKPEPTSYIVIKCIIPKGTLYYKGIDNEYPQEICAKTMILDSYVYRLTINIKNLHNKRCQLTKLKR